MKYLLSLYLLLTLSLRAAEPAILGLGSPCIDYILSVEEDDLERLNLQKGGWHELQVTAFNELVESYSDKLMFTGDCAANTIKGLASLGMSCALTGNVGKDNLGSYVKKIFGELHVKTLFTETDLATAQVACLVTPDGERSFFACIAAQKEIADSDLKADYFEGIKLVHIEGYRLTNGVYIEKAMEMARKSGAKISLDLANAAIVKKYRERLLALIEEYTDILFLNEKEAYNLTRLPPEESAIFLKNFCPLVVVKVEDKGCWIASKEGLFHSPAIDTVVIDKTGAGDLFDSAFLYGYLNGYSLKTCAWFGNLAGSAAVQKFGAELSAEKWMALRESLEHSSQN